MDQQQMDMLKLKHSQHVRLLQEQDEDMWISSEDLRTDGESDEESFRRINLDKKCTKQLKNEALLKKVVSAKVAQVGNSTYQVDDSEFLRIKSKCELNQRQSSSAGGDGALQGDSNLACSSSGNEGKSESDVEALNLESKWRPKRGSLKLPNLVEGDVTNVDSNGLTLFYNELLLNLHTLQRTPLLNEEEEIEDYTFDDIPELDTEKDNATVKEAKDYIKKLDDDIAQAIGLYKAERQERLETQKQMCETIYGNGEPLDRQSQIFLSLCEYQHKEHEKESKEEIKRAEVEKNLEVRRTKSDDTDNKFIKRNIELAKRGNMANVSLTDEEKRRLETILSDSDNLSVDEENTTEASLTGSEVEESQNAYTMSQTELDRLEEINQKLKDLCHDHEEFEKNVDISVYKNMSSFSLEKALHDVDKKLVEINDDIEKNFDFDE